MIQSEFSLGAHWVESLRKILEQHVPNVEVWVYGSRVGSRGHAGSDLDLVLIARDGGALPSEKLAGLREAIRESNIPILVDVHEWSRLTDAFKSEIQQRHEVLATSSHKLLATSQMNNLKPEAPRHPSVKS
jgi:predicted nucleotidyltransferase